MRHALTRPLALSILLALLAGGLAYVAQIRAIPRQTTVAVIQTTRSVAAGQRLSAADLGLHAVPVGEVSPDAARSVEQVVGRYVTAPLLKGETVLVSRTSERVPGSKLSLLVPSGCVAVSVAVSDVVRTGGFLLPGDRVDVLGVVSKEPTDPAEVVVRDAMLLAVSSNLLGSDTTEGAVTAERSTSRTNPRSLVATVTLAVTTTEAQRLVQVDELGTVRLVLRSGADETPAGTRCGGGG